MDIIENKWTIQIIEGLLQGKNRFSEFLEANPGLSSKVLTQRLNQMVSEGLLRRNVVNTTPTTINYHLTRRGLAMKHIIFEMAIYAGREFPDKVFNQNHVRLNQLVDYFGPTYQLEPIEVEVRKNIQDYKK